MFTLYRRSELNVSQKLVLLYLLNVLDVIFTFILLNSGLFVEANPMMVNIIESPFKSFLAKAILPALLLLFVGLRIRDANELQIIHSHKIINFAVFIYFLINISHVFWISLLKTGLI